MPLTNHGMKVILWGTRRAYRTNKLEDVEMTAIEVKKHQRVKLHVGSVLRQISERALEKKIFCV